MKTIRTAIRPVSLVLAISLLFLSASSCAGSAARNRVPSGTVPSDTDGTRDDLSRPSPAPEMKLAEAENARGPMQDAAKSESIRQTAAQPDTEKRVAKGTAEATVDAAKNLSLGDDLAIKEPELLSYLNGPELERINLASFDVTVIVTDITVRIVYDMVFRNDTDKTLSGTLMTSLPKGASPSYLGMFDGSGPDLGSPWSLPVETVPPDAVLGKHLDAARDIYGKDGKNPFGTLQEAKTVDPVKGRETYEQITRKRVDPALAEWSGGSSFSTKVYPILPKSGKRVVFSYDRPLPYENGAAILALPVPKTVTAEASRMTVHVMSKTLLDRGVTAAGKPVKATLDGSFSFAMGKDWKGSAIFTAKPADPRVSVMAGTSGELDATVARVRFSPDLAASASGRETGKAVFVLDTSLSAKPRISAMQVSMLKAVLESEDTIAEFAVIAFDVRSRDLTGGFRKNTREERDILFKRLSSVWLEGATDLRTALSFLGSSGYAEKAGTCFLLSDGQITWGPDSVGALENSYETVFGSRWICYGFGDEAVNQKLFDSLTRAGGLSVQVNLSDGTAKAALAHRSGLSILESVTGSRQEEILVAGSQKNVAPGQAIEFGIKARKGQESATVTVTISGRETHLDIPLSVAPASSFLACRSWADIYVSKLLDLENAEADRAALSLSQAFALSNRAASFLILENENEYVKYDIKPEWLSFRGVAASLKTGSTGAKAALDVSDIGKEDAAFAESLKSAQKGSYWNLTGKTRVRESERFLFEIPPEKRANDNPSSIYRQALAMAGSTHEDASARAFRTITSIAETKSRDDVAMRMTGFALFSWGMWEEAADLFSRVRERRPFESQAWLMEAVALQAAGKYADAALRYEIILKRKWARLGDYARETAKFLYSDLLEDVIRATRETTTKEAATARQKAIATKDAGNGRLILLWNLDNVDVDLHVLEPSGEEVYYEKPKSKSGGKLYWDNTEGLGPELYEHPSPGGFKVSVDYFGSSSVEGAPPSSTFVMSFLRKSSDMNWNVAFHATILDKPQAGTVDIVPAKWGTR